MLPRHILLVPDRKQFASGHPQKCLAHCTELRGVHRRDIFTQIYAAPHNSPGINTVWGSARASEWGLRDENMHTEDTSRAAPAWAKEEASCFGFCSSFGFMNHSRATNRRLCTYLRR